MNDVFFIDSSGRPPVLYSELWREWSRPFVSVSTVLQGADVRDTVVAVARAVVLGHPLVLPPPPSPSETVRDPEARQVPGLRQAGWDEALAAARGEESGFSLTLFTSGSTGLPRAVTHRIETLARAVRLGRGHSASVWGLAYDPAHIAGVQVILQALLNRNPLVHIGGADPANARATIRRQGITHLSATPSFYRLLLSPGEILPSVRAAALGGERADPPLILRLGAMFPAAKIRNLYGSTEAGTILEADGDLFRIPPDKETRVRIAGGQIELHRSLLGAFPPGQIATTEPRDPARSDAATGRDEWYRTGDVVEIVSENPLQFRIVSRERDWVNIGGEKINPGPVELSLLSCPGVREARVYGRANSVTGQILCAEVVAEPAFSEPVARAWLAERLPAIQIPRLIKIVPSLPRARTGKTERPGV